MKSIRATCLLLATVLATAIPARAEDPSAIVDLLANALGGRGAIARAGVVHLSWEATMFGMSATVNEWSAPDGRHRLDVNIADMFQIAQVYDGQKAWMRDQTGKVNEMSGTDLADEITNAYLASWSYLFSDRVRGTAESLGTEEGTGRLVVRFRPASGVDATFFLDPKTFLPDRIEQPAQERTARISYTGWHAVAGIQFPTTMAQSTGDPQFDATFTLKKIELAQTPAADTFVKPGGESAESAFTDGATSAEIPMELNTVHIFVKVRVNGSEPLSFILDTGASASGLDSTTARSLGLDLQGKIEGRGAGGASVEANMISDVTFELPGVAPSTQTAFAMAIRPVENLIGREVDGILGYDFISRFVTVIDYRAKKIRLYDRKTYEYTGRGNVIPIRIENGHPHVMATVTPRGREPITADFLVDCGADAAVSFTSPFTDAHDLLGSLAARICAESGFGVGGASTSCFGRVDAFDLGGLVFRDLAATFSRDTGGALADPNMAGLIGGDLLSRTTVILDYERNRMILEPLPTIADPVLSDACGLTFTTGGRGDWHTFTVLGVVPGAGADKAGIRVGDVVLRAGGMPAAQLTMHRLWDMTRQPGVSLPFELQRDGKKIRAAVKTKSLF